MKIIEAKNQSGTVAMFDEATNQRTQWVALDTDTPKTEEAVKDYIEDQQPDWVDASDLEDDQGQIQYKAL
jgi:hypothetical protein